MIFCFLGATGPGLVHAQPEGEAAEPAAEQNPEQAPPALEPPAADPEPMESSESFSAPAPEFEGTGLPDDVTDVEELSLQHLLHLEVVSASKVAQRLADAPSNLEIVSAEQIREWGCRDLKDLLRRIAGYPVVADRDEWVFAARGNVSDNNMKYLILIDGHRMNSIANFGPGQIIELPMDLSTAQRVEIIRGPGSAVWGPDALAGVINIVTKNVRDIDATRRQFTGTVGDRNMYRLNFQLGEKVGQDSEIMAMGSFAMQDGRYVSQSASTTLPIFDEQTDQAAYPGHPFGTFTTPLERRKPGYMLHLKARTGALSLTGFVFNTKTFNRQFEYGQGRENYLTTTVYFAEGGYRADFDNGVTVRYTLSSDLKRAEYMPEKQGDWPKLPFDMVWLDNNARAAADVEAPLADMFKLLAGVDYTFTKIGPNHRINNFNAGRSFNQNAMTTPPPIGYLHDPPYEDHQAGGYLQGTLLAGPLQVTGGARFDYNAGRTFEEPFLKGRGDQRANVNPRGSIIWIPVPTTSVKLIYNRGFLRPAHYQSASTAITRLSRPEVPPVDSEVMDQFDAVWLQQVGNFTLSTNAFWQRLKGFISIITIGGVFTNTGDYESKGVELATSYRLGDHSIWANGSYSFAEVKNAPDTLEVNAIRSRPDGRALSFPAITANAGATARFLLGRLFVTPMVRFLGEVDIRTAPPPVKPMGERASLDEAQYATVGPHFYLDLSVGYDINRNFALQLYGDNLLDNRRPIQQSIWNGTIDPYGRAVEARLTFRY
jgi:outer membrane receptor protein involved in Fe transport